jgi:hypothetical protein
MEQHRHTPSFLSNSSNIAREANEMAKAIYGNKAPHMFKWLKRCREGHENHEMIQNVGGHQLFEIRKLLQQKPLKWWSRTIKGP